MQDLEASSISEIPSAQVVGRLPRDAFIQLPVVILSFSILEKVGILLVTDFTGHPELGFAKGCSPSFLPQNFRIGTKTVPPSQIMAIGVFQKRIGQILDGLRQFGPSLDDFDPHDETKQDLSRFCLLASVKFRPQLYNGGIEGFFNTLYVWKNGPNPTGILPRWFDNQSLDMLLKRLASRMSSELYNHLSLYFPITSHISAKHVAQSSPKSPKSPPNSETQEASSPNASTSSTEHLMSHRAPVEPPKRRRLDPSAAIFRQQFTQASSYQEGDPTSRLELSIDGETSSTFDEFAPSHRYRPSTNPESTSISKITNVLSASKTQSYVDFAELVKTECADLEDGICFDTRATILEFRPPPELVFVKAFGRTMKISPFSVVLERSGQQILVEVSSEDDICKFFDIFEVEVAMNHMSVFRAFMNILVDKELKIRIVKKTRTVSAGISLPSWAMESSLRALCDSITSTSEPA